jgi:ascorbate PTS system EIIA or EIIAB component
MSRPLTLADDLDERTVRANVGASDWKEAVERAGALLVAVGAAEPRYVDAMQAMFEEHGAYAVIAPGIALPHARPEQGVVRPGLALVTLTSPVEFGHATNDPVDVVIAFAAVDKSMHVQALQQLAGLLGDEPTVERIRAATTDGELLEAIHGLRGDGPTSAQEDGR